MEESYTYSTLWVLSCEQPNIRPRLGLCFRLSKSLTLLLLLMAGDIETCRGPTPELFSDIKKFARSRGLKIFHQNVRGLSGFGKIEQLRLLLTKTNKDIQFLGITETHLNNGILDEELQISGYRFERKDREKGPCGGTAVYIRDDIQWQRRKDLEVNGVECLWIELFIKNSRSVLLGVIYRPPDTSKYLNKDFDAKCEDMLNIILSEDKEVIMTGDLNCNYKKRTENKALKEIIKMNGLDQVIKESTRVTQDTSTLIDVVLTTHSTRISKSIVSNIGISDHEITGIIRRMHCMKFKPRKVTYRDYSHYDIEAMKSDLNKVQWEDVLKIQETNAAWNLFKEYLSTTIEKYAPLKQRTVRGRDCPWLNQKLKIEIRERDYLLAKSKKSGKENDWSAYRRKRNAVTKMLRTSIAKYNQNLLSENAYNPKRFWKEIKKCFPSKKSTNSKSSSVFYENGVKITDKKDLITFQQALLRIRKTY
eukprot:gene20943-22996_t